MLRLAFDFIITWRETRTRPNAYKQSICIEYPQTLENYYHLYSRNSSVLSFEL